MGMKISSFQEGWLALELFENKGLHRLLLLCEGLVNFIKAFCILEVVKIPVQGRCFLPSCFAVIELLQGRERK